MNSGVAPAIAAMESSGFYNRNSSLQAAGIAAVLPLWEATVRSMDPGTGDLMIADYGSSQGRNSMLPIRMAIDALRAKVGTNIPVEVVHTDLPSNDFASLFTALERESDSYMSGNSQVFPSAIGRSYFDPVIREGRVTLGWNSWTLQWMSRAVHAPDHIFARFSNLPSIVSAVANQQEEDWQRFLQARAFEMRAGAKLLSLFVADDPNHRSWRWLGGEFWGAIVDMGEAGLLAEQEKLAMTFPTNARALEQIAAPFQKNGEYAGLRIEHLEIFKGSDPFWDEFQTTGDTENLGRSWADMMKAVFRPTALNAIVARPDREKLIDELFLRFASRVASNPRENEHYIAVVILVKSG